MVPTWRKRAVWVTQKGCLGVANLAPKGCLGGTMRAQKGCLGGANLAQKDCLGTILAQKGF